MRGQVTGSAVTRQFVRKRIVGLKPMAGSPIMVANYYNVWNILEWDQS